MIQLNIQIKNLDQLRANFSKAPGIALSYIAKATKAAIFEIEKQAVDKNFQFKTPRPLRTGFLQQSFSFGRFIAPSGLYASIGPTVHYAPYVYFGTSRGVKPNPFMERIAAAAEPDVNRHFETAVDLIVRDIAKV
jgi:hypothetical protein